MATRIVLHIGQQKSGTTYLQHGIAQRAREAATLGLHYPVPPAITGHVPNHHQRAFYGLLAGEFPYISDQHSAEARSDWEWLAQAVRAQEGTVLLSSEALAFLRPSAVRSVIETLGVADICILITARDLARNLGSAWQQNVRAGADASFEEFLTARAADRERGAFNDANDVVASPWRAYNNAALVHRWAGVVGIEQVTLVTNGASDSAVLWRRFLTATGVPGLAELPEPKLTVQQAHIGLTWPEAELLTSINAAIRTDGLDPRNTRVLRSAVIQNGFVAAPQRGRKIGVPAAWLGPIQEWAADDIEGLRASGVAVVGDLAELTPRSGAQEPPSADEIAGVAATAVLAAGRAKLFQRTVPIVLTPRQRAERFVRRRILRQPGPAELRAAKEAREDEQSGL